MSQLDFLPQVQLEPEAGSDERYTTPETMVWCLRKAGVSAWSLDAAACAESHWAGLWYGIEANGLERPWVGATFCNPPFSDCGAWVAKAWREMEREGGPSVIGMILPANRTEQPFWQDLIEPFRDIERGHSSFRSHFMPGRTRYGFPGNPKGIGAGSPPFGSVFLVWKRP